WGIRTLFPGDFPDRQPRRVRRRGRDRAVRLGMAEPVGRHAIADGVGDRMSGEGQLVCCAHKNKTRILFDARTGAGKDLSRAGRPSAGEIRAEIFLGTLDRISKVIITMPLAASKGAAGCNRRSLELT